MAFWALDRLRGGSIRRHMADIAVLMAGDDSKRDARLKGILEHASASVPFYQDLPDSPKLNDFPVVNKAIIRSGGDAMLAQGFLSGDLHIASTSGSTGTPFQVRHDREKRERANAEAIFWGRRAGYELGVPLFHLKVWSNRNRISTAKQIMRNVVPVDVTTMGDPEVAELLKAMRRRHRPISLISYASALEQLAKVCDADPVLATGISSLEVDSILAQSEHLSIEARGWFLRTVGTLPQGRYGLEELGIVAQQVPGSDHRYQVNRASFLVEILESSCDLPAAPGTVGRIVVTDLASRAQPMIRYDTGDLGAFRVDECGELDQEWLEVIHGRQADQIYDAQDRPVSPMVMYKVWWRYPEIRQYQLIQDDRAAYTVRLNAGTNFFRGHEFASDLERVLGVGARVTVELVDEDFVLSSGKHRVLVGHYRPTVAL